jgi:hypothetical protein
MLTYARNLTTERESLTASATSLTDAAASESRDLTETEMASLQAWSQRCADIDRQLGTLDEQMRSQRAYAELRTRLDATEADPDPAAALAARAAPVTPAPQGWGELFVASDAFRNYEGRGSSGEVLLPGLFAARAAGDPITVGGFPGGLPPYYFTPTPWQMTTPLLDALGKVATSSGTVTWYEWPGSYPSAAKVAEAAAKPGTDIVPVPHTDALETFAHWQALSRQALEDIPQVQSVVENALRGGVLAALEAEAAAALAAAGTLPSISNPDLLAGIRIAVGDVQSRGYASPNAVLLNPADFAALDLAVMAATVAGPQRTGSVWGVPAIAVGAIPAGTAYVGDFKTAVTLFARNQVSAFLTDSHADYFIRNLLVILAEQRALVAVTQPAAAEQVIVGAGGTQQSGPEQRGGK